MYKTLFAFTPLPHQPCPKSICFCKYVQFFFLLYVIFLLEVICSGEQDDKTQKLK